MLLPPPVSDGYGVHPASFTYRILALLARGAKVVDLFTFGPKPIVMPNTWSDKLSVYSQIADALGLIGGQHESFLYQGVRPPSTVALLTPAIGALWQAKQGLPLFGRETEHLHLALTHAGCTVDMVDQTDVENGLLESSGYAAVYLTCPNVSQAAQDQIVRYVEAGGVLAVTLGATTADEFNEPTTSLDAVLGVGNRGAHADQVRDVGALDPFADPTTPWLTAHDTTFASRPQRILGPAAPLTVTAANVLAYMDTGAFGPSGHEQPVVTHNKVGASDAVTYGYLPGTQYRMSGDRGVSWLLRDYDPDLLRIATAPVIALRPQRPEAAFSQVPGVEVCRLDSPAGVALIVLNWTDRPIPAATVRLPSLPAVGNPASARGQHIEPFSVVGLGGWEGDTPRTSR